MDGCVRNIQKGFVMGGLFQRRLRGGTAGQDEK